MVATQPRTNTRQCYATPRGQQAERLGGGWGGAVYRQGGTVRRQTGPWTPAVHALLQHLESVGFDGAPRVLGIDDEGREVLTFIEGQTCASVGGWPVWSRTESNLVRAGRLLRQFHDAVETFRPGTELTWRDGSRGLQPGEIIGHNDVSLANLVADADGHFHSIIDWDNAGPTTRAKDLAYAAWHVVGLNAPAHARARGWTHQPDVAGRLAVFLKAYGLTNRDGFVDEICARIEKAIQAMVAAAENTSAPVAQFVTLLQADVDFIESNRELLENALTDDFAHR